MDMVQIPLCFQYSVFRENRQQQRARSNQIATSRRQIG